MTRKDQLLNAVIAITPLVTFGAMAIFLHLAGVDQPINLVLLGIGTAATMWMLWEWKRWTMKQAQWRRELAERGDLDDPTPVVDPPNMTAILQEWEKHHPEEAAHLRAEYQDGKFFALNEEARQWLTGERNDSKSDTAR